MFRSLKIFVVRMLFVGVSLFGVMAVAEAEAASLEDSGPLAVLRAHMERTGEFDSDASAKDEKTTTTEKAVKAEKTKKPAKAAKAVKAGARRAKLTKLISKVAKEHGVPVALATAVVTVESNFNPGVRGGAGEVGLMQIKPATARGMGFRGTVKALYQPQVNLEWGMRYLAEAHRLAGGDVCGTILRYNAGHYARRMNPISRRYCNKVKSILG